MNKSRILKFAFIILVIFPLSSMSHGGPIYTDGLGYHTNTPRVMIFPLDHLTDEHRGFQGIPGLVGTAEGRFWATWYGGGETEDGNNVVMLATSGDWGETWSEVKIMIDAPWPVRCYDPTVWLDPSGRLWLFWGQAYAHGIDAHTWAMVTENPNDENPVWNKPFIVQPGVMMNKPIVLSSGDWLMPISNWEDRRRKTVGAPTAQAVVSKDNGKTFEVLGAALIPAESRNFDEHMFIERKDGTLWMLVRTEYGIGESVSQDGGVTWPQVVPSPIKHVTARFFIRRLNSGNLLLVKHGEIDRRLEQRSHLKAFISRDDGRSWEGGLLIDERVGVSYPDGFQDDMGTIYIIYDYSRTGAKEILMASFTEEDVLAATPLSKKFRRRHIVNKATNEDDE